VLAMALWLLSVVPLFSLFCYSISTLAPLATKPQLYLQTTFQTAAVVIHIALVLEVLEVAVFSLDSMLLVVAYLPAEGRAQLVAAIRLWLLLIWMAILVVLARASSSSSLRAKTGIHLLLPRMLNTWSALTSHPSRTFCHGIYLTYLRFLGCGCCFAIRALLYWRDWSTLTGLCPFRWSRVFLVVKSQTRTPSTCWSL